VITVHKVSIIFGFIAAAELLYIAYT